MESKVPMSLFIARPPPNMKSPMETNIFPVKVDYL